MKFHNTDGDPKQPEKNGAKKQVKTSNQEIFLHYSSQLPRTYSIKGNRSTAK
jgi:hypothetical protein